MTSYRPLADHDPFPGVPGDIRSYAARLVERADAISRLLDCLRAIDDGFSLTWTGDAAANFRSMAIVGRQFCLTTIQSLHNVAEVMGHHANVLDQAQRSGQSVAHEAAGCEHTIYWLQQRLVNTTCTDPRWPAWQQQLADAIGRLSLLRRSFHDVLSEYDRAIRQAQNALQSASNHVHFSGLPFDNPVYQRRGRPTATPVPVLPEQKLSRNRPSASSRTAPRPKGPSSVRPNGATEQRPNATAAQSAPTRPRATAAPATSAKPTSPNTYGKVQVVTSQHTVEKSAQTVVRVHKQGRNFGGSAQAEVHAGAKATVTSGVDKSGANLGVSLELAAGVTLSADGSFRSNYVNAEAEVHATIEAKLTADGVVSITGEGVAASAGVAAFLGGEVGTSGHVDVGGVGAGGDAGFTYGVGGSVKLDAKITKQKISIGADLGATVGVGGHATFQIDLHPAEIAHSVASLLHL